MATGAHFLLIFALLVPEDETPLKNGGFEQGMEGWLLINNSGHIRSELDRRDKKEGKQSLRLERRGAGPFDTLRADLGPLHEGKKVTVSGRFKAEDLENAWLKIFFYDGSGDPIKQGGDVKSLKGSYNWKEIEITNKVPEGTERAAIFILIVSAGELWVDDVRVTGPGLGKGAPSGRERPRPLDRGTRSWLDRNAVKVATLGFDGSLADLKPLKKILKDTRIVQLGEETHGSGASFRAKARLARFLHQEMDFEVLAFESGLFECELANELLAEGKVLEGMDASVFGVWRVEETRPLFEYLASQADSRKPLRLSGFDLRGSGTLCREFLLRLYDFMAPAEPIPTGDKLALSRIDDPLNRDGYRPGEEDREKALAALEGLRNRFDQGRDALVQAHGERMTAFYSRCLDNYRLRERLEHAKNGDDPDLPLNLRDERMAANLIWLAEVRYPEKKILCWAATSHLARNLGKVSVDGNPDTYRDWKNMGQHVHERFGDSAYTIAFAAYEGEGGPFSPTFVLDEPREDSLEDLFSRYGQALLFVDLRRKNPFEKPGYCSPMSYNRNILGPWPEVVDALFFIREMTASTRLKRE